MGGTPRCRLLAKEGKVGLNKRAVFGVEQEQREEEGRVLVEVEGRQLTVESGLQRLDLIRQPQESPLESTVREDPENVSEPLWHVVLVLGRVLRERGQ